MEKDFTCSEDDHTGVPLTIDLIKGAIGPHSPISGECLYHQCDAFMAHLDSLAVGDESSEYEGMTFKRGR